jgi:hypothetical protein
VRRLQLGEDAGESIVNPAVLTDRGVSKAAP